ncbi:MAG: DNA polymerase IV [Burkholderiaceae bacterium]|jgi:DNA polymerase-4
MRRWIAHLDMDAFYASVELLRYPELRGAPVVIGGSRRHAPERQAHGQWRFSTLQGYRGRGVATTATYEARALGLHSGMSLAKAAERAPQAVLLPVDFDEYRRCSRLFKAAVAEVAPVIEDRGIDEIYIDLTEVPGSQEVVGHDPYGGVRAVGQAIRNSVRQATGLSCSVGITPNKLLSKLASELEKPNGLTVLTLEDLPTRIWPLSVARVNGIGPKAQKALAALGVHTIGELAAFDATTLRAHFGRSWGQWLHEAAHGRDDRPVVTYSEPLSMSRETTFERDLHVRHDRSALGEALDSLVMRLATDLQRKGYTARTVGIKLKFEDFKTVTREWTLPLPIQDAAALRTACGQCLKRVPIERRIRLLGVRAGGLCRPEASEPG